MQLWWSLQKQLLTVEWLFCKLNQFKRLKMQQSSPSDIVLWISACLDNLDVAKLVLKDMT